MSQASEYAANVSRILQQKGDAIAEGKRRSGAIIGNTVATLGQVIPQQVQEAMKRNAEKRKTEQIQGIFQKHGADLPSAIGEVMQVDPDLGMDLTKRYQDAATAAFNYKTAQWKAKKDEIETLGGLIGSAKDQNSYTQALVTAHMMGLDVTKVPQEYTPEIVDQYNRALLSAKERIELDRPEKPQALMNLGGGAVYDPNTRTDVRQAQLTPDQQADNARMAQAEAQAQQAEERTGAYQQAQLGISRGQLDVARQNARTNAARAAQQGGGGGGGSKADLTRISPALRLAYERVTVNLPDTRRANADRMMAHAMELGGEKEVIDAIKLAAIDTEPVAARNLITGRQDTIVALNDAEVTLKQLAAKGVNTNLIRGMAENGARALGTTTNPELAQLANRLQSIVVKYRHSVTGAQFGDKEAADYAKMFPNYSQTLPLNLALIAGLKDEMASYDKSYWTRKVGAEAASSMGFIPGATPQGGSGGAPRVGPRPSSGNPYEKKK